MTDQNEENPPVKESINGKPLPPSAHHRVGGGKSRGFWGRIRGYFLAGVLVTAPLGITGRY